LVRCRIQIFWDFSKDQENCELIAAKVGLVTLFELFRFKGPFVYSAFILVVDCA
jgi:hypothetical protein